MKYDLERLKAIPITEVLALCGYEYRSSTRWISVKNDSSLKANVQKNTYTDFSGRLGSGSTIDLVMNTQGVSFPDACKILTDYFFGGTPIMLTKQHAHAKAQKEQVKRFIASEIVSKSLKQYDNNNLFKFESLHANNSVVTEAFKRLCVGTAKEGATLFFYTDKEGKTHYVKQVLYNAETGKRTSKICTPRGYDSENGYKQECLFNEHNAKDANVVFVVESEKTVLRATIHVVKVLQGINVGKVAFVATGGANKLMNLKENIKALAENAIVILLPDCDTPGRDACIGFYRIFGGGNIYYLDLLPDCEDGSDLADFLLSNESEPFERLATLLKMFQQNLPESEIEIEPSTQQLEPELFEYEHPQQNTYQNPLLANQNVQTLFDLLGLEQVTDDTFTAETTHEQTIFNDVNDIIIDMVRKWGGRMPEHQALIELTVRLKQCGFDSEAKEALQYAVNSKAIYYACQHYRLEPTYAFCLV